jgi:hypothetical protein
MLFSQSKGFPYPYVYNFIMNHITQHCFLLLISLFIFKTGYSQSPWVNHKEVYTQLTIGTIPYYSDVFQGNQGKIKPIEGSINEWTTQAYLEYGWTKKVAVIADLPYRIITSKIGNGLSTSRKEGTISGVGNIGLGLKYNFIKKPFLLSGQVIINLPTLKSNEETGLRTGYQATSVIPTLSLGNGYNKSYFYVYTGVGLYTDGLSNDIRYGAEYGYFFFNRLWVIATLNARESLRDGNIEYTSTYEETHLFVNNQSYTNFALKLIYEVSENSGITGSANIISVRANNLPYQRPFSLGVYYKLKPKGS